MSQFEKPASDASIISTHPLPFDSLSTLLISWTRNLNASKNLFAFFKYLCHQSVKLGKNFISLLTIAHI